MIKEIITYPNPILRKPAEPVSEFGAELKQLINDLADTMFAANGAGIAANQIGIAQQVVLINSSREEEADNHQRRIMVLINPEILEATGEQLGEEGCLSVLDYAAKVKRAQRIMVRAQNENGKVMEFTAEDFLARVIQHECDHLIGKLFIDRISSLKRALYKKKLKRLLQQEAAELAESAE